MSPAIIAFIALALIGALNPPSKAKARAEANKTRSEASRALKIEVSNAKN